MNHVFENESIRADEFGCFSEFSSEVDPSITFSVAVPIRAGHGVIYPYSSPKRAGEFSWVKRVVAQIPGSRATKARAYRKYHTIILSGNAAKIQRDWQQLQVSAFRFDCRIEHFDAEII